MVATQLRATEAGRSRAMARVIGGMGTSHVPGVGFAIDNAKSHEDYWQKLFAGFEPLRAWHRENVPDVNIIVFTICLKDK